MKALVGFLAIVAVLGGVYFAYMFIIGKGFSSAPQQDPVENTASWKSQSDKSADLMQQQRELMRQRQERMRDLQRR